MQAVVEAPNLMKRIHNRRSRLFPSVQPGFFKRIDASRPFQEAVGLVLDGDDTDAHGSLAFRSIESTLSQPNCGGETREMT